MSVEENQIDEEVMVKLAQQGNTYMEESLIQKYKNVVKMRANSYFMVGADRDDVVQEGMIGVFKAIRDYDAMKGATFSTFVELCINRQIVSAIKRASRLKHSPLNTSVSLNKPITEEGLSETLEETISDNSGSDPEALLLLREELEYIDRNGEDIFSNLEWKVWTMFMQGLTYTEIAKMLNKSPKAIDNAIQRAKKKLELFLTK